MGKIGYIKKNGQSESFRIAFMTLGCKVNRYETDGVRQLFLDLGFSAVDSKDTADVYVINTCTVTAEADRKSGQAIRRMKKQNPDAVVASMGCRVQIMAEDGYADVSAGTGNRTAIVQLVIEELKKRFGRSFFFLEEPEDSMVKENKKSHLFSPAPVFPSYVVSQEDTRAYIKIEDGCDAFCSYCIIPYVRGRIISRPREDVIREAKKLAEKGFREVVLTGIHICSYGKDQGRDISALAEIIEDIAKIDEVWRIRLSSLEPKSISENFLRRISRISKLCPHFHLSLQSGSDAILKRMNRNYSPEQYEERTRLLRKYFPGCGLTTDVIVAFPGESEEEHKESLAFCEKIGFSKIHIFPFSPRAGTPAAKMEPKIPSDIANKRKKEFAEIECRMRRDFAGLFVGDQREVLIEKKTREGFYTGYTKEYIRIYITSLRELFPGSICSVHVKSQIKEDLYGYPEGENREFP